MCLLKPYKRTVRQLIDGSYSNGGNSNYIKHPDYAESPERYIKSFLLIQSDILKLFEYIEPVDKNKEAYSYRVHELFIRVCIEIESNFKAILRENGYSKASSKLSMRDYKLIEKSHKLSEYEVVLPRWEGKFGRYLPYKNWTIDKNLHWYTHYNNVKHDIHTNFKHANIKNLVEASCGLAALISSQFLNQDFSANEDYLVLNGMGDGMESTIGGMFRVKYPTWKDSERYGFIWNEIKKQADVIQCYKYSD